MIPNPLFPFHYRLIAVSFLSLPILTTALETCPAYTCSTPAAVSPYATRSPPSIRFPFTRNSASSTRCGYPGFRLTCNKNNHNQTTLTLPLSGDFSVQSIDYSSQIILLTDPHNCIPKRLLSLDLSNSPFSGADNRNHTFLNCTDAAPNSTAAMAAPVPCLSGRNRTVYLGFVEAAVEELVGSGACSVIKSVWSPSLWPVNEDALDLDRGGMALGWDAPDCSACERRHGVCGFSGASGLQINCSVSDRDDGITNNGASKMIKYGLILGLGIPGFVLFIGLIFYLGGWMRNHNHHNNTEFSGSIFPQAALARVGLDGQTIESYPKTVVGESGRLPNPADALCAICLSDYQPKEMLRSIPECKHYFHVECVDEWLSFKASCPLCRTHLLTRV